ncbi:MAG: HAD family hydrolase [Dehalococcoidia bacterium]
MPPRSIFLDMDDTLLNTSGGVEASWSLACGEFAPALGIDAATLRERIRREAAEFWRDEAKVGHWRLDLVGARVHVIGLALEALGLDVLAARPLGDRYGEEIMARHVLFDDAIETLEWLRGRGYRLGLLTNGPREMQTHKVARFDLERHFDVVVIEGVFGKGKPERAVFEHALSVTGARPEEAWHIGDNLYADIGGAQNAGIHAVWIHRDRLEMGDEPHAIPDRVIGHLTDLRDALEG